MYKLSTLAVGALLLFSACGNDEPLLPTAPTDLDNELEAALEAAAPDGSLEHFVLPQSDDFARIPQDANNPLTRDKVELGKLLFHETGLALNPKHAISMESFSCASCHFAGAGFQANRVQGIADGGIGFGMNGEGRARGVMYDRSEVDVQPLRSPSAMNLAYQKNLLWSGQFGGTHLNVGTEDQWTPETPKAVNALGFEGLETQAIAGLGVHRLVPEGEFFEKYPDYRPLFDAAFPERSADERYSTEAAGLAIGAYERTLLANQAPFQEWLAGDMTALSEQEKEGAILFFTKGQCATCHNGPALANMEFHAIGMKDLIDCPEEIFQVAQGSTQRGRGDFTKNPADDYKFKVPQLYNLTDSPFYGHGSSFRTVEEVIAYKNEARAENERIDMGQLSEHFVPLGLTTGEIAAIAAFVKDGLRDPDLRRYEPSSLPSGNCFPNADPLSKQDLGCE